MLHTSPGVYTRIIDQSDYINGIPIINSFIPFFADRGKDNELVFLNGEKTLRNLYPVENHSKYGEYKWGWLLLRNWLRVSASAYGIRLLPEDAAYSNLLFSMKYDAARDAWYLDLSPITDVNSEEELNTIIAGGLDPNTKPLILIHGLGRGESYNKIAINVYPAANIDNGLFIDIYDVDANGDLVLIKDILVTIDPEDKYINGENNIITKNLELFSERIRAKINEDNLKELLHGNSEFVTYSDIALMELSDPANGTIVDGKAYYTGANPTGDFAGNPYSLAIRNGSTWTFKSLVRGSVFYFANAVDIVSAPPVVDFSNDGDRYYIRDDQAATGEFAGHEGEVAIWRQYAPTVQGYWEFESIKRYMFDGDDVIEYFPFASMFSAANSSDTDYKYLGGGSDGALIDVTGKIVPQVAVHLLIDAYYGNIDDNVINTDMLHYFFNFCPYQDKEVKDAAANLAYSIRMDNICITDVGHNATPDIDIARRNSEFAYNSFLVALYGNFSKVYDNDIQDKVWVSPVYHMAKIIPYTYDVADLATPPAGLNRALIPEIEELAYEPKIGDRDNLYNNQINEIAKFKQGPVVWGQLTSQRKTSALQDINVVVVYLYMKVTLEQYCNNYIFEKDVPEEMELIKSTVQGFLNYVKDNGLIKELITLDVGQTPEEEKRKIVHVNIVYKPVRSIEKIMLTFYVRQ